MRRNQTGCYEILEGEEAFIKDDETGEKIVFLLDKENEVVIRSFLEDDIEPVVKIIKGTSSEKRNYKRNLLNMIPQKGSENYAFVVEKIVGSNSDNYYEKDRALIGVGFRDAEGIVMHLMSDQGKGSAVLKLVDILAKVYKINGQAFWRTKTK